MNIPTTTRTQAINDSTFRVICPIRHPVGGIRTYLLYNYPLLHKEGFRYTFIAPEGDNLETLKDDLSYLSDTFFISVPKRGHKYKLRPAIRNALKDGGTVIHSQGLTAGIDAIIANLGIGLPHLITSHDVFRPDQFRGLMGHIKRLVFGQVLKLANVLITVSEDAEKNHLNYLPALRKSRCRVKTILNGIDTTRFESSFEKTSSIREKLNISPDVFLLGFMGRFMEQKGFTLLIDAIDSLMSTMQTPPFHVLAVGSGDYIREYKSYLNKKPSVPNKVSFIDRVSNSADIFKELDLLVIPSRWEACPLLPMEALCYGLPVIGSDCIGLREVLEGTPATIFKTGDSEALAGAIAQALNNPNHSDAISYAPEARTRFDIHKSSNELKQTFLAALQ